jgi:general secretion pathway protein J
MPARNRSRTRCPRTAWPAGVTLLELLVVIAVFSIMSVAAYSSLRSSLKAEENFDASMKELEAVQMTLTLLQKDVMQLSPRTVRDAFGDRAAAFILYDGRELTFTRGGNFSSLRPDHSELTRVAWSLQDDELIRSYWNRLDTTQGDQPLSASLLHKVTDLQMRVLDQEGVWHLDWPLSGSESMRALEITLELEGWGEIRRLVPVPG